MANGFLAEIVGHERPKQVLKRFVERGTIPHALLFSGPKGVGKAKLARRWAQWLLCGNLGRLQAQKGPCGDCPSCRYFQEGQHPDYFELPDQETAAEASIGVEDVRRLIQKAQYRPVHGERKILVVNEAQLLTEVAQNALLKSLEELPEGEVLLLIAHVRDRLLPTVISRSVQLRFAGLRERDITGVLRHKGLTEEQIETMLPLLGGRLQYLDDLMEEKGALAKDFYRFFREYVAPRFGGDTANVSAGQQTRWLEYLSSLDRGQLVWFMDFVIYQLYRHMDEMAGQAETDKEGPSGEALHLSLLSLQKTLETKKYFINNGNLQLGLNEWLVNFL